MTADSDDELRTLLRGIRRVARRLAAPAPGVFAALEQAERLHAISAEPERMTPILTFSPLRVEWPAIGSDGDAPDARRAGGMPAAAIPDAGSGRTERARGDEAAATPMPTASPPFVLRPVGPDKNSARPEKGTARPVSAQRADATGSQRAVPAHPVLALLERDSPSRPGSRPQAAAGSGGLRAVLQEWPVADDPTADTPPNEHGVPPHAAPAAHALSLPNPPLHTQAISHIDRLTRALLSGRRDTRPWSDTPDGPSTVLAAAHSRLPAGAAPPVPSAESMEARASVTGIDVARALDMPHSSGSRRMADGAGAVQARSTVEPPTWLGADGAMATRADPDLLADLIDDVLITQARLRGVDLT